MNPQLEYYRQRLAKYGANDLPHRNGWASKETQNLRFQLILWAVSQIPGNQDMTILDFGCGTAELAVYLWQNKLGGQYIGVDGLPENIRDARRVLTGFPGNVTLFEYFWDGIEEWPFDRPDIVIESGAFATTPDELRDDLVIAVADLARVAFIGNFHMTPVVPDVASGWELKEAETLFDEDEWEIQVTIDDHLAEDFTIFALRK